MQIGMGGGTGPIPIFRLCDEIAPDGVVVNVGDLSLCRARIEYVAVVAAAALPEAVMHLAVGLAIFHPREKT